MQIQLFQSMASLLSAVLRRWPLSRFPVYGDAALMTMLSDFLAKPDACGKVEVLKLLSSIGIEFSMLSFSIYFVFNGLYGLN